jgi:hypothetical protein
MIDTVKHTSLEELRKVIYELTGNHYPDERLTLLEKKLVFYVPIGD